MQQPLRFSVLMLIVGALTAALAAPAVIGTATASGSFFLDRAAVHGNATVLDGTLLETVSSPSLVRLDHGARVQLDSASRARVFANRVVLEKGVSEVAGSNRLQLEAGSLRILPEDNGTATRVSMAKPGTVTVAAVDGNWRVTTAQGLLLARLSPGSALEFQPQAAGASAPLSLAGCVTKVDGHYLLRADNANVTFELRGADLAQHDGQRASVTATPISGQKASAGASQVIQVLQIKGLGSGCATTGAASASTSKTVPTAVAMSATTKTVIAGVAIAAVAGGTTLGLTRDEDSRPSISR